MKLNEAIPGTKVTYDSGYGKIEKGIIKGVVNRDHVSVVYHCSDNWEDYKNYTGETTHLYNLTVGWGDDDKANNHVEEI